MSDEGRSDKWKGLDGESGTIAFGGGGREYSGVGCLRRVFIAWS